MSRALSLPSRSELRGSREGFGAFGAAAPGRETEEGNTEIRQERDRVADQACLLTYEADDKFLSSVTTLLAPVNPNEIRKTKWKAWFMRINRDQRGKDNPQARLAIDARLVMKHRAKPIKYASRDHGTSATRYIYVAESIDIC